MLPTSSHSGSFTLITPTRERKCWWRQLLKLPYLELEENTQIFLGLNLDGHDSFNVGLNRIGHISFLTGLDRTLKLARLVLRDQNKSGLTFFKVWCLVRKTSVS